MRFPQGWELVVLLLVILVLFGGKRLPDAARGLGRSLRIFKSEVGEAKNDKTGSADAAGTTTVTATADDAQALPPADPASPGAPEGSGGASAGDPAETPRRADG